MTSPGFEYVNHTYWEIFGPSFLEAFLDEVPKSSKFVWHLKRYVAYVFVFVFYPLFIFFQILGICLSEDHSLEAIAFFMSFSSHNIQNMLKMGYFLTHVGKIKSFCLDFSLFNTSKHRPLFSKWALEENAKFTRKLANRCYAISYVNVMFWVVLPTATTLAMYALYLTGNAEPLQSYIPRYSPVQFPFEVNTFFRRLAVASMEIIIFTIGFFYFQPIDVFFASAVHLVRAQYQVLNASLFQYPEEVAEFWNKKVPPGDNRTELDLKLFVEDHQFLIKYARKIRSLMNVILGLVTGNCMAIMGNTAIVIISMLNRSGSTTKEMAMELFGNTFVFVTTLITFYVYCWMCDILKTAEQSVFFATYSCKWYEKPAKFRKDLAFVRREAASSKPLTILKIGDMGKETFLDGLRLIYSFYNFMERFQ